MNDRRHPLIEYPEDEKIDYLSLIGTIAAADGHVTDAEIAQLREFCETIEISGVGIGMILAVVENPAILDAPTVLSRLAHTDLKFTLLTDMLFMAYADQILSPAEEQEIQKVTALLGITPDQIQAINHYVSAVVAAQQPEAAKTDWAGVGSKIAGMLASASVPPGAVTIAGTVFGSGITSGLTALGMGLGMPVGIGVAVSLGVSSYFGVRWLFKKIIGAEQAVSTMEE